MNDILPNTVPRSGERYNVTLDKVGESKGNMYARWVIDGGDFRGKKVSCLLDTCEFHISESMLPLDVAFDFTSGAGVAAVNVHTKHIRASAIVKVFRQAAPNEEWISVDENYRESNVRITYDMESFKEATEPSELAKIFKSL